MCVDENGKDTKTPIVFSEWAFVTGTQMQRKDYTFDELVNQKEREKQNTKQDLFSQDAPDEEGKLLKQYISDFRRVQDNG